MRAIQSAAGLSVGSLRYHFKSEPELIADREGGDSLRPAPRDGIDWALRSKPVFLTKFENTKVRIQGSTRPDAPERTPRHCEMNTDAD